MTDKVVLKRPAILDNLPFSFCPGCHHSTTHKLIAEVLEELKIENKTIGVVGVGCCAVSYKFFKLDFINAAHGRAMAVATGIKRVQPDKIVFTYQGDGDLAAIGLLETIHTANRGENITVIFINNAIYGMTGGQMAPTTLIGQKTTTTPKGKTASEGDPLRMCELLNTLKAPAYIHRVSLVSPGEIVRAKKVIDTAFRCQIENKGFSFVEVVSNCPTNWKMTPLDSLNYINVEMKKYFPPKKFRSPYNNKGG